MALKKRPDPIQWMTFIGVVAAIVLTIWLSAEWVVEKNRDAEVQLSNTDPRIGRVYDHNGPSWRVCKGADLLFAHRDRPSGSDVVTAVQSEAPECRE